MNFKALFVFSAFLLFPLCLSAQDGNKPAVANPCEGKVWWADTNYDRSDFDFWVGEWQVFDRESGLMVGFDKIEKIRGGCALRQHWHHMNDLYSIPGVPWRMQGGSDTALAGDGRWHQVWIDNNGGYVHLSGGLDENGVMVLQSDWIEFKDRTGRKFRQRHRWHWDPQEDGTIHNWGYNQRELPEATDWIRYYDIIYRRNAVGGPTANFNP